MSPDPTFTTVTLPDDPPVGLESSTFARAQADARTSGSPVVVSFIDQRARARTARVFLPSGDTFSLRVGNGPVTVERVIAAARQSALRGDGVAALAAAFAAEHLSPTVEQANALERFTELAVDAARCDHAHRCCREHDTHSSPHVRCILR